MENPEEPQQEEARPKTQALRVSESRMPNPNCNELANWSAMNNLEDEGHISVEEAARFRAVAGSCGGRCGRLPESLRERCVDNQLGSVAA